jgi:hypothetical protein
MKKVICNAKDCVNKGLIYFMPINDEKVMCGGCKVWVDAVTMTEAEIASTFDYDYKPKKQPWHLSD